ncbi:MAG TPA: methyltransferase domain-containing protein [Chthoniobacterales bacterium]|jgi:SAM-dependent methyltransferase
MHCSFPPGENDNPLEAPDEANLQRARYEIAHRFLAGRGLEVGAGARPFPLPQGAEAIYGDIRDEVGLTKFFGTSAVTCGEKIDAQTLNGIPDESVDFLISAHVIEHLRDPLGAIVQGLRVLKRSKPFILVVPEMRLTFDRHRPETTIEHVLRDFTDGGESTCFQAYEEHLRYVHPYLTGETYVEAEIQRQATENARRWREFDVHFHAWTRAGFEGLLKAAANISPFRVEEIVAVANENIFVLCKARWRPRFSFRPIRRRK